MTKWLRWLAVLPAAVIAFPLALFPLRWVLYQTLTGSGIVEPYPEAPERLLTPLVGGIAFVWGGAWVAPVRKVLVAKVLCAIWVLFVVAILAMVIVGVEGVQYEVNFLGAGILLGLAAGFVGVHLVSKKYAANELQDSDAT